MLMSICHVKKEFNGTPVLRDVNMDIDKGDVVVILGPSGSGKTTFLRCLNFLERADGGELELDGKTIDLHDASNKDIADVRRKTAFVFQNYNLFANKTVLENVTLGLTAGRGISKTEAEERAREALQKVGMLERADAYPAQLSGGQQQRVALARTLAQNPEIILADEPVAALDPVTAKQVMRQSTNTITYWIFICNTLRISMKSIILISWLVTLGNISIVPQRTHTIT